MYGRYDVPVYNKGAKILRNFIIRTQGPITFRPGFEFITNTAENKTAVLKSFVFNDDLAYALEFTEKKIRFYKDGALVLNSEGNPYELATPYLEADDLSKIQVASTADIMHICHPKYKPRKLIRKGDADWGLTEISGTNFPFTSGGNYPRAVAFAQGRCWYGGTDNAIDKIWASKGPDSKKGEYFFDDFTTGESDTSAMTFILTPPSGKVEAIEWIVSNNKFLLVGTYSGVSKLTGGSDEAAVTPSNINVRQITDYGVCSALPASLGSSTYYAQRNRLKVREIKYYLAEDAYLSEDKNLVSTELTGPGIKEITYTQGEPDVVWATCVDGILIGMTTDKTEGINGWHRHYLGGDGFVESITSIPRKGNPDQLYAVIRRKIDGKIVRYVEFLTDEIKLPLLVDFYTGDEEADKERWYNAIYQAQLEYRFLDSCVSYYGNDYATKGITIEPTGKPNEVSIKAKETEEVPDSSLFEPTWVGRQIWGEYDSLGHGGGRYRIKEVIKDPATEFYNEVIAQVLTPADVDSFGVGKWYLTTDILQNLDHLEGKTVGVFASGQSHPDRTVSGGQIELDAQYHVIHVGLKYVGIYHSMDIELGGGRTGSQSTLGTRKRLQRIDAKLKDTLGVKFGTSIYNVSQINFADTEQRLGMPPRPFSGIREIPLKSGFNNGGVHDTENYLVIIQEEPQPCTIQTINMRVEATDE